MDGQRLPLQNRGVQSLLGLELHVVGQQDFGTVRLTIDVDQQDFFPFVGQTSGEGNRGRCFTNPAFLGGDREYHRRSIAREAG